MSGEKVLLVTTWGIPCGIAEHSAMLKEAIESQSNFTHEILTDLHPAAVLDVPRPMPALIVLNYHAALLSQWHPAHIKEAQRRGSKVLVIYHDSGVPNTEQCKALYFVADAFVIHEPAEDLPKARYIRMGVPDWTGAYQFDTKRRPMLGTIGFPFGWKNYDALARITAECGWDLLLLAPTATKKQEADWKALNPRVSVSTTFLPRELAIEWLAGCDATAFAYVCHNGGQSAAILQGIAARKPVIALKTCRQFRSLYEDPIGRATIRWAETFDDIAAHLRNVRIQRVDPGIVALAEQESWTRVGQKYIDLYRELLS